MDNKDPQNAPQARRSIWELDCLSICVLLKYGLGETRIRKLFEATMGRCCRHKSYHPAYLLQMAHSACHQDGEWSRGISRELDSRFQEDFSCVEQWTADVLYEQVTPERLPSLSGRIGVVWALLTSDDQEKQNVGHFLIHVLFSRESNPDASSLRETHLEHQCEGLRRMLHKKQQEADDMLSYIHKTRPTARDVIGEKTVAQNR